MTEQEWLSSADPTAMLECLPTESGPVPTVNRPPWPFKISDRKLHLFEDACFAAFGLNLEDIAAHGSPFPKQSSMLRCIVGNPFRPQDALQFEWVQYRQAKQIAQRIYEEDDFSSEAYFVLADALEEAGCGYYYEQQTLLWHLRGFEVCPHCLGLGAMTMTQWQQAGEPQSTACPHCKDGLIRLRGPHVRGCHVIDCILGKD